MRRNNVLSQGTSLGEHSAGELWRLRLINREQSDPSELKLLQRQMQPVGRASSQSREGSDGLLFISEDEGNNGVLARASVFSHLHL